MQYIFTMSTIRFLGTAAIVVAGVVFRKKRVSPSPAQAKLDNFEKPTEAELHDVCLSYSHDYGLLPAEKQAEMRFAASEWLHAWRKTLAWRRK